MFSRRLLLCLPFMCLGGCSWIPYAIDNVTGSTANVIHERRFKIEAKALADEAWSEIACGPGNHCRSSEYEKGFKAGFFDYLDCNGNCDPPAAPPRHLRSHVIRTPEQQQDIIDWFAGFRHGAETAALARWRERIVIPISLPPQDAEGGFSSEIVPPLRQSKIDGGVSGVLTFDGSQPRRSAAPAANRGIVPAGGVVGVLTEE